MQEGPFDEVALVVRKPPKSTLWVWGLKLGGGVRVRLVAKGTMGFYNKVPLKGVYGSIIGSL